MDKEKEIEKSKKVRYHLWMMTEWKEANWGRGNYFDDINRVENFIEGLS